MRRADWLVKTLMLGKIEGRRRRDEMVAWHHWLNGHEFDQNLEDSEKQESLACCSPWGWKELKWLSDWTTTQRYLLFSPLLPQSNSACWASCAWNQSPLFGAGFLWLSALRGGAHCLTLMHCLNVAQLAHVCCVSLWVDTCSHVLAAHCTWV